MTYELVLITAIILVIAGLIITIINIIERSTRSEAMIREWAAENGYEVLDMTQAQFTGYGDFFWTTSGAQTVYKISVVDETGQKRQGRIRCGSRWGGPAVRQTEVRWDD